MWHIEFDLYGLRGGQVGKSGSAVQDLDHLHALVLHTALHDADPPAVPGESRKGVWVKYSVNNEAVTDLYLRLGVAIGEF